MGHPERVMPFCVRTVSARVRQAVPSPARSELVPHEVAAMVSGNAESEASESENPMGADLEGSPSVVGALRDNYQTHRSIRFDHPITTDHLEIALSAANQSVPAALFEVRCYAS